MKMKTDFRSREKYSSNEESRTLRPKYDTLSLLIREQRTPEEDDG